jgi:cell division protein FtsQ
MNDKVEKTRGAKVRASRAKSRVGARKKSRGAALTPRRGPDTSPHAGRGDGGKPAAAGPGAALPQPGSRRKLQDKEGKRRERPAPDRGRDASRESAVPATPVEKSPGRRERRKKPKAAAAAVTAGRSPEMGAETVTATRMEEGKRARRAGGRRGSPARTVALGAILLLSLGAMLWVYTGTGVLNVKQVEFVGNERLQAAYLRSLSGITTDTHLLRMNVGKVESALLSEPYVARADVSRHYPNKVIIAIVERRPSAYIMQNNRYSLVDQEGMVLESVDAAPPGLVEIRDLALPPLLPGTEISGIEFAEVTSLIGSLPQALRDRTEAVGLRGDGSLYISAGGTTVIYGEAEDFSRKNTIALMTLESLMQHYGAVEYIDVSYPEHPVIKPYGAA